MANEAQTNTVSPSYVTNRAYMARPEKQTKAALPTYPLIIINRTYSCLDGSEITEEEISVSFSGDAKLSSLRKELSSARRQVRGMNSEAKQKGLCRTSENWLNNASKKAQDLREQLREGAGEDVMASYKEAIKSIHAATSAHLDSIEKLELLKTAQTQVSKAKEALASAEDAHAMGLGLARREWTKSN